MEIENIIFNEIVFITDLIIKELSNDINLKHDFKLMKSELIESNMQQNYSMKNIKRIYLKYRTNEIKIYDKKIIEYVKTIQSLIQYLNEHLLFYDEKSQTPVSSSFENCLLYFFDILESLIK